VGLAVQIKPGIDPRTTTIVARGKLQHLITDQERASFGLEDGALKDAIARYFGKAPNDAFLRSPIPWSDLYRTYDWTPVSTVLMASSAQLLSLTSRNSSRKRGTVTNSFETSWDLPTSVELSRSVEYSLELPDLKSVGGSTAWRFEMGFGAGGSQSRSISIDSYQGVSADVDPGEWVPERPAVNRGVLRARIVYDVYLTGLAAIHYDPTYKGHQRWALPIEAVMQAGGIQNHRQITQDITVEYHSYDAVTLSGPASEAA